MKFGMMFEQGEILIVPFPFSNLDGIKQRPILVISNSKYNNNSEDIITCGITSNLKDSDYSILFSDEDLDNGKIPIKSRIKIDKLFTLNKSIIIKRIGKINNNCMNKVKKEFIKLV